MRTIATALLVGALALSGCDKGSESGNSGGAKGSQTQGASNDATTPKAGSTTGAKAADAKPASKTQAPTPSEADLDRATAEGTLGLFVLHMQQGEFQEALMLTDPESSGYSQIEQAVNVLAEAAKKSQEQSITLEALMRAFMSRGWLGAVYEPVTVQDERARFELSLVEHEVKTMDLRKIDEDWYVVAPDWIIVKGDVSDLMPNPTPGKPAAPPMPVPNAGGGQK